MAATPTTIATINAVLLAAIVSLLAIQAGASNGAAVAAGALGFAVAWAIPLWWARRAIASGRAAFVPMSPQPSSPDAERA